MTKDSAGTQQILHGLHVNYFHTFTAFGAATSNSSLVAATSTSNIHITDIVASSDTICSFTFVRDTAGTPVSMMKVRRGPNNSFVSSFTQALKVPSNKDFGVTTDATISSLMIMGYRE